MGPPILSGIEAVWDFPPGWPAREKLYSLVSMSAPPCCRMCRDAELRVGGGLQFLGMSMLQKGVGNRRTALAALKGGGDDICDVRPLTCLPASEWLPLIPAAQVAELYYLHVEHREPCRSLW